MTDLPADVAAAILAAPDAALAPDRLERVRTAVREMRDLAENLESLEEARKAGQKRLDEIRQRELVDLYREVGLQSLTLEAEGNHPAVEAKLKPFYRANIAADWPQDKRDAAFAALTEAGGGDLIRYTFTITLNPKNKVGALQVRTMLHAAAVDFQEGLSVPWATLTAWVKEQITKYKRSPPLEALGATVGEVVELKPLKKDD